MAITLVGKGYIKGTAYQDQTITFGSTNWTGNSPQAGDIVIAILGQSQKDGTSFTINTSGYTSLTTNPISSTSQSDSFLYCAYKVMGSTPDTSISVKGASSTNYGSFGCIVLVFRNQNSSTPIDTTTTEAFGTQANNPPSITTTKNNCLVIAVSSLNSETAEGQFSGGVPTGYTSGIILNFRKGSDNSLSLGSMYKEVTTAGSVDPDSINQYNTSGAWGWCSATIALRPLSSGPANVKTINGLEVASVKIINGLEIANVKTINGLA